MTLEKRKVAVIGTGPAGLMAATIAANAGHCVTIFEKKKGPGRKLLIAGASGLNITYDAPTEDFFKFYTARGSQLEKVLEQFSPAQWLRFIEDLGIPTFKGTSRRYFVKGMKASHFLRAWLEDLRGKGVDFHFQAELLDFNSNSAGDTKQSQIELTFANGFNSTFDAVCFALGGASYEAQETPLRWPQIFQRKGLVINEFAASNVGYNVAWPKDFLKESEGKPLKNILFTTAKGSRRGDVVITSYGIEGTPIYFCGQTGRAFLDFKPDLDLERVQQKLIQTKERLSPLRRLKRQLGFDAVALSFFAHHCGQGIPGDESVLASLVKRFPLDLLQPQPLQEAISSSGGLSWDELDETLMFRKFPGCFAAGEMLDWDAPTGGFLIQGCASQGYVAGKGLVQFLA